ncbi:hypothetical protein [Mycolicibacterium wolinskyi]|uniref:hypothetical protein n=1 Tax=Mycolicibacterium wolinskyi TaxID=59750 RepID=UPI0039179D3F
MTRQAGIGLASLIGATALAGCSAGTPDAEPPVAPTVSAPPASAGTPAPVADCATNPSTAPVPSVEPYGTVPDAARISLTIKGIPSHTVTAGGPPTEVEVTLCNDSAIAYPQVGVVLVLSHCSCAPGPLSIPTGSVERFDDAAANWVPVTPATAGTGMDFVAGYSNVHELPKGKTTTMRYRIALDASMTAGEGGVEAVAVTPEPLNQIGSAELSFAVVT